MTHDLNTFQSLSKRKPMKTTVNKSNRPPKSKWGLIVKIILTVASAVAGAFGISACQF